MGDHSLEPVDETCLVINFIVRTSKKYILFILFSYVFKSQMVVAREMYNSM